MLKEWHTKVYSAQVDVTEVEEEKKTEAYMGIHNAMADKLLKDTQER